MFAWNLPLILQVVTIYKLKTHLPSKSKMKIINFWTRITDMMIIVVTTLALGSRLRQGFRKLQAKRGARNHTMCSRECERMWANEPSHPQGSSTLRVKIPVDSRISEGDCKGQNSMDWRVPYIIENILELRCLKWACMTHLDILYTSYGQKKGQESNWQFDSWPLKVGNQLDFLTCKWCAISCWKDLNEGYNFASNLISIRGLHTKLWSSKVPRIPTLAKCHLDVGLVGSHRVYYKGEGDGLPQVWPWWVLWIWICPWLVLTPKMF